jgi:hypothetical protein
MTARYIVGNVGIVDRILNTVCLLGLLGKAAEQVRRDL